MVQSALELRICCLPVEWWGGRSGIPDSALVFSIDQFSELNKPYPDFFFVSLGKTFFVILTILSSSAEHLV